MLLMTSRAESDQRGVELRRSGEIDRAEWDSLFNADPRALACQQPRWVERHCRHHPGDEPAFMQVRDDAGTLVAGLPFAVSHRVGWMAWTSGVGGSYGGPLCLPGNEPAEARILAEFASRGGRRVVRRELVWGHSEPPAGAGGLLDPIDTSIVPLEDGFEGFWSGSFPMNRRNECNRSERRGMTVEISRDPAEIEAMAASDPSATVIVA